MESSELVTKRLFALGRAIRGLQTKLKRCVLDDDLIFDGRCAGELVRKSPVDLAGVRVKHDIAAGSLFQSRRDLNYVHNGGEPRIRRPWFSVPGRWGKALARH